MTSPMLDKLLRQLQHKDSMNSENKELTHTRIGCPQMNIFGGRFHIADDPVKGTYDYKKFVATYVREVVAPHGASEYLTEKQLDKSGPILVDLDLKYDANIKERQHTSQMVVEFVRLYLDTLAADILDFDAAGAAPPRFPVFVMEKDDVVVKPNFTKDGIHIVIGLALDRPYQIHLRQRVLAALEATRGTGEFASVHALPMWEETNWAQVIDEGVIKGNSNWQLYGSAKPGYDAYKLTYHFDVELAPASSRDGERARDWCFETKFGKMDAGDQPSGQKKNKDTNKTQNNVDALTGALENMQISNKDKNAESESDESDAEESESDADESESDAEESESDAEESDGDAEESDGDAEGAEDYTEFIENNFALLTARYADHAKLPLRESVAKEIESQLTVRNHVKSAVKVSAAVVAHMASCSSYNFANEDDVDQAIAQLAALHQQETYRDPDLFNFAELNEYLMALPKEFYDTGSYDRWIRVGFVLKNTSPDLFPLWVKFSAQTGGFHYASQVPDMYQKWTRSQAPSSGPSLTYKSIRFWCKQSNHDAWCEIRERSIDNFIHVMSNTEFNETDIAEALWLMYKDKFICAHIKGQDWYEFSDHRWRCIDSGTSFRKLISTEFYARLQYHQSLVVQKLEQQDDSEDSSGLQRKIKNFNEGMKQLKKTGGKSNIMTESAHRFHDKEFLKALDNNTNLMGFKNGVVDFANREFRPGRPDDYISISTNIDYNPIDRGNADELAILAEVDEFFEQLFPNAELREYMWQHLSASLIGTIKQQVINMYVGSGRNGKSKLVDLMNMSLGDYAGSVPVALITQRRGNIGGTSSEVAQLRGIRYAVMQESSKNDVINDGVLKQLTGGDQLQARELYKESITFVPQFSLVMCTNNLPEIGSTDDGIWRRMRIARYRSKFTENPYVDETAEQQPHQFKVDMNIDAKFGRWSGVFVARLVELAFKNQGIVRECDDVMEESRRYRNDQDIMADFFQTNIERSPGNVIAVQEVKDQFTLWFKQHHGRNEPKGKDLFDYMDKRCGHAVDKRWYEWRIVYGGGGGGGGDGGQHD